MNRENYKRTARILAKNGFELKEQTDEVIIFENKNAQFVLQVYQSYLLCTQLVRLHQHKLNNAIEVNFDLLARLAEKWGTKQRGEKDGNGYTG